MKYFGMILVMLCTTLFITGCGNGSKARDTACQSNLKQIGLALMEYGMDNIILADSLWDILNVVSQTFL